MCNHKWMAFGIDVNGNYRICSKCGKKVYIITNADRIRSLSDEELAEWMSKCNAYGENAEAAQWLPWLRQPAEGEPKWMT